MAPHLHPLSDVMGEPQQTRAHGSVLFPIHLAHLLMPLPRLRPAWFDRAGPHIHMAEKGWASSMPGSSTHGASSIAGWAASLVRHVSEYTAHIPGVQLAWPRAASSSEVELADVMPGGTSGGGGGGSNGGRLPQGQREPEAEGEVDDPVGHGTPASASAPDGTPSKAAASTDPAAPGGSYSDRAAAAAPQQQCQQQQQQAQQPVQYQEQQDAQQQEQQAEQQQQAQQAAQQQEQRAAQQLAAAVRSGATQRCSLPSSGDAQLDKYLAYLLEGEHPHKVRN